MQNFVKTEIIFREKLISIQLYWEYYAQNCSLQQ